MVCTMKKNNNYDSIIHRYHYLFLFFVSVVVVVVVDIDGDRVVMTVKGDDGDDDVSFLSLCRNDENAATDGSLLLFLLRTSNTGRR